MTRPGPPGYSSDPPRPESPPARQREASPSSIDLVDLAILCVLSSIVTGWVLLTIAWVYFGR